MKRFVVCLMALLLAFPLTGCNFLTRILSACRASFSIQSRKIELSINCSFGARPPAEAPGGAGPLAGLQKAVNRGLTAAAFDECRDFCGDPGSPECDDCRTAVGSAVMQPYVSVCQGTAYQTLPDRLPMQLEALTDRGRFISPVFVGHRDRGTTRWDDCGGENADYVLPEAEARAWERSVYEQGARTVERISATPVGGGAADTLFQLKEEYRLDLDKTPGAPLDPGIYGVGVGFWAFNGGGIFPLAADGAVSTLMMPTPAAGFGSGLQFSGDARFAIRQ